MINNEDKGIHDGHRARMRAKFEEHGARIFDTYELLEMLLYTVIPLKDTNPIAKRLLMTLGGLSGVLGAEREHLLGVSGIGESAADFITIVGKADGVGEISSKMRPRTTYDDFDRTGRFFVNYFKDESKSGVVLMLLDDRMRMLGMVDIPSPKFGTGATQPRYFIDAAMRFGATVAIVAYTHGNGIAFARESDVVTCKMIANELSAVGVTLLESYIVAGDSYAHVGPRPSFRTPPTPEIAAFEKTRGKTDDSSACYDYEICGALLQLEEEIATGAEASVTEKYLSQLLSYLHSKNSDALARDLALRYGSLDAVLAESIEKLTEVVGSRAAHLLKLVAALISRSITDNYALGVPHTDEETARFINALFYGSSVETVYVLSLDERGRVKFCDYLGEGTVNASDVYPRKIIECVIRHGSHRVILAHNHPSGSANPSGEDMVATASLYATFRAAGVDLLWHVTVSERDHFVLKPDPDTGVICAIGRIY